MACAPLNLGQQRATMLAIDSSVADVADGAAWLAAVKATMKDKLLREVYGAIVNGFDTRVLIEGQELFDEAQRALLAAIADVFRA